MKFNKFSFIKFNKFQIMKFVENMTTIVWEIDIVIRLN